MKCWFQLYMLEEITRFDSDMHHVILYHYCCLLVMMYYNVSWLHYYRLCNDVNEVLTYIHKIHKCEL